MSKGTIPPDIQAKMVEMFREGSSFREIATTLEYRLDEVRSVMSAMGICRKQVRNRHNEVFEMVAAGLPRDEICQQTGYSPGHLESVIHRQRHIRQRTKRKTD